jgi:Spy/CpxP family protein refolding chaperone
VTWNANSPSSSTRLLATCLLILVGATFNGGAVFALQTSRDQAAPVHPGSGTIAQGQASPPPTPDGRRGPNPGEGRGGRGGPSDYKFWKDPAVVKEIGLTLDQATKIDRIYEDRARRIAPFADELDKERAELDRLIRERTVDTGAVELQASKSTTLLAKIQETRIVMLYRQYMVLTPDQHKKLQAILERQRAAREYGRGRGNVPRP